MCQEPDIYPIALNDCADHQQADGPRSCVFHCRHHLIRLSTGPEPGVPQCPGTRLHHHSSVSIRITSRTSGRSCPAMSWLPVSRIVDAAGRDHGRTQVLLIRSVTYRYRFTIGPLARSRIRRHMPICRYRGESPPLAITARCGRNGHVVRAIRPILRSRCRKPFPVCREE